MSDSLLHIFDDHQPVTEVELLQYLNGELSQEQRHQLEQRMAASDLLSDAEEGLSQLPHKEQLPQIVAALNKKMTEQLQKKRRSSQKAPPSLSLILVATFLILVLIILAFVVIYKMKQ